MIVNKHGRFETDIVKQIEEEQQADLARRESESKNPEHD
jgi:hypothetical protein